MCTDASVAEKKYGLEMTRSRSYIALPPGATIKEQLDDRSMSQKEFASRMGMSEKHISNLINGEVQLTHDVAYKLEMVLGVPANFWNNLEAIYREKLTKVEMENSLDKDTLISKKLPYAQMAEYEWVPTTRKDEEKVINLRKFFEVASLSTLDNYQLIPQIACRRLAITEKADFALIAWAQKAKIEARSIPTQPINLKRLNDHIPDIRKMTAQNPEVFCPVLLHLLSDCGIALVFLPHIGGSFLHGATFYDKKKIVIGLTIRGKDADKFWFSLFHEIGHILLGHLNQENGVSDQDELAADKFAQHTLIPESIFNNFIQQRQFTCESITTFAKAIEIDPGIVVGRLQKEGYIKFNWHNNLKTKYILNV